MSNYPDNFNGALWDARYSDIEDDDRYHALCKEYLPIISARNALWDVAQKQVDALDISYEDRKHFLEIMKDAIEYLTAKDMDNEWDALQTEYHAGAEEGSPTFVHALHLPAHYRIKHARSGHAQHAGMGNHAAHAHSIGSDGAELAGFI